jgi:molybdate transport system substrate-binding protein
MKILKWLGFILLFAFFTRTEAKSVHVAVAANFRHTMQSLVTEFEKSSEFQIALSFGSSGKFYAQIKQGAPFELFFSADQAKPDALQKDGLVVETDRFTYAIGRLALWSSQTDFVNKIQSKLRQGAFSKLALANPKVAPYGAATLEVLKYLALIEYSKPKWVIAENVAQTYQFVSTGNAELGFVALSQLLNSDSSQKIEKGSYWLVPETMHQPIKQDVVLLRNASDSLGARAFLDFLHTDKAQSIITSYGYLVENNKQWVQAI